MDEYRKIQKTPAEKRLDDGISAGIFLCVSSRIHF